MNLSTEAPVASEDSIANRVDDEVKSTSKSCHNVIDHHVSQFYIEEPQEPSGARASKSYL